MSTRWQDLQTAAGSDMRPADATPTRTQPLVERRSQRPARHPGEPAGLGVTPRRTQWRTGCAWPHPTSAHCPGCEPPEPMRIRTAATNTVGEVRLTADHDTHPYLIRLHRGQTQLAYAIRGSYGWAICARTLIPAAGPRRPRSHGAKPTRAGIATIGHTAHDRYAVEAALLLVAARGGVS